MKCFDVCITGEILVCFSLYLLYTIVYTLPYLIQVRELSIEGAYYTLYFSSNGFSSSYNLSPYSHLKILTKYKGRFLTSRGLNILHREKFSAEPILYPTYLSTV